MRNLFSRVACAAAVLTLCAFPAAAQISLPAAGSAYTQDFNTLASTGTSNVVPTGWAFLETGSAANATYAAGDGSFNGGNTYSFGTTGSSERAFGTLLSSSLVSTIGASFTNNTGVSITSLAIAYAGEQWRLGTSGRTDRLDFQYSLDATSLTTGTWTDVNALDLNGPISSGTVGALDGNAAANRAAIFSTINGLSIPNGATFWIRWTDFNASGSDDGLAVDDFSLTPNPLVVLPNLSITNVGLVEGNSGTKTATFTVYLDAPAGAGGVTFDIATADNSATVADNDYVAKSLTGQTIAAGATSYTFDVTVNGDVAVEPNESYFVNVTNVAGANVADGQGTGTIYADDGTPALIHELHQGLVAPGSIVTLDAVVVGSFQGPNAIGGFFLEEEDADWFAGNTAPHPTVSEGIWVFSSGVGVSVGDRVQVTGTLADYYGLLELSPVGAITVVSTGNALPAAVEPPVPAPTSPDVDWEPYESMRVSFPQTLYVTDNYSTGKYGEIGLSASAPLRQPTNFIDPNDDPASGTSYSGSGNVPAVTAQATANTNNFITLDDGLSPSNLAEVYSPVGGNIRVGNTVTGLAGVMSYQFGLFTVQPTQAVVFTQANPRPASPPSVGSAAIKVGFQNTLSFYVNTGTGRGAANATEFANQRSKLVASLAGLGADVIGLSELEKDPSAIDAAKADNAAAQSLAAGLSASTGHTWVAVADPWTCETDGAAWPCNPGADWDIKSGIIYDSGKVTPLGSPFTDLVAPTGTYSRAPYAQAFTINATGGKFVLIVNHFRSKGTCSTLPSTDPNADKGDGQGCYNAKRVTQALTLAAFASSSAVTSISSAVILVGDFNAYAEEDPIDALRDKGFTDVIQQFNGVETSFAFEGKMGHIDHAFVSGAALPSVTGAGVWHINSPEPPVLDYVSSGKPADYGTVFDASSPYRSSDHDPIVVGIVGTVPVTLTSFDAE